MSSMSSIAKEISLASDITKNKKLQLMQLVLLDEDELDSLLLQKNSCETTELSTLVEQPLPGICKISKVAGILEQTVRTVQNLCNDGTLERAYFPGRSRAAGITQASLQAYLSTLALASST